MSQSSAVELMPLGVSYQELSAQPDAVAATLRDQSARIANIAKAVHARTFNRIYLLGCGDSYYASWAAKFAFESLLGIPCEVVQAFEYAHYVWEVADKRTLVIGLSSSGRSQASVQAVKQARRQGAFTVGVTNTPDSSFTQDVDAYILVHATREGWPTQASTAALASLYMLVAELADVANTTGNPTVAAFRRQIDQLPTLMAATLASVDQGVRQLAEHLSAQHNFLYVGAGPSYGTAHFGMAKLKEASQERSAILELEEYSHIESFALKEGDPVFVVAPPGQSYIRAEQIAAAVRRCKGQVIALIDERDKTISALATYRFLLPPVDERLSPLVYILPLHLFAHYLAVGRVEHGYKRPLRADFDE